MSPNLRESAARAAALPPRHLPRYVDQATFQRGAGVLKKVSVPERRPAFDATQLEDGMPACWDEVRSMPEMEGWAEKEPWK